MLCSEWSLVKRSHHHDTVIPLRCRCWHCDECRPLRTYQLIEEAKAGNPDLFITLTSRRRPGLTPDQAAVLLAHAWRSVRAAYLRKHGRGSLPFLAVFERTKKGWPHIHIVARCRWLDQRWLSDQMRSLIGSPVVDVRRVHGKSKVAAYVTKYISKNPERFDKCKRYWRSIDYLKPISHLVKMIETLKPGWEIWKMHWTTYAALSELGGAQVVRGRYSADISYRGPP